MMVRRSVMVAMFVAAATAGSVVLATSAWAWCTPYLDRSTTVQVLPNRALADTVVTVEGRNWAPGRVEVRWATATGKELGSAVVGDSLSFSVPVTIPDEEPGARAVYVVHGPSQRSATFQILAPNATTVSAPAPESSSEVSTVGAAGAPAPATATTGDSGTDGAQAVIATPQVASTGSTDQGGRAGTARTGAQAATVSSQAARGGAISSALHATAGQVSGTTSPVAPGVDAAPGEAPSPAVDGRVAAQDLWSGFAAGSRSPVPSLINLSPSTGSPGGPAAGLVVAMSGLVALFAGFAFAELTRRRRATVAAGGS